MCCVEFTHQGVVCPVWQQKCLQSFDGSTPGRELDACLWSLTEVLKRLLEGAHGGEPNIHSFIHELIG